MVIYLLSLRLSVSGGGRAVRVPYCCVFTKHLSLAAVAGAVLEGASGCAGFGLAVGAVSRWPDFGTAGFITLCPRSFAAVGTGKLNTGCADYWGSAVFRPEPQPAREMVRIARRSLAVYADLSSLFRSVPEVLWSLVFTPRFIFYPLCLTGGSSDRTDK
jgi:hypothetical protein